MNKAKMKKPFKKVNTKLSVTLTIIALLELLIVAGVVTHSWIEETNSLAMSSTATVENGVYETIKISQGQHGSSSNNIDLNKYFYKTNNFMLSKVSSADGKNFYLPSGTSADYRKANINDVNRSFISFEVKVQAAAGNTDIWFNKVPTITLNDSADNAKAIRFAISDVTNNTNIDTKIFKVGNDADTSAYNSETTTSLQNTESFDSYVFNEDNVDDESRVLFSINKGETKILRISLWLESEDLNYTADLAGKELDIDIELCTSWSKYVELKFIDENVQMSGEGSTKNHWVSDASTLASEICIVNLDDNADIENGYRYVMTKSENEDYTWAGHVPIAVSKVGFARVKPSSDGIDIQDTTLWNYWIPNKLRGNETDFVALWGDLTDDGYQEVKGGYGFWGESEVVTFKYLIPILNSETYMRIVSGTQTWIMHRDSSNSNSVTYKSVIPKDLATVGFYSQERVGVDDWSRICRWVGSGRIEGDTRYDTYYAYYRNDNNSTVRGSWKKVVKISADSSPENSGYLKITNINSGEYFNISDSVVYAQPGSKVKITASSTIHNFKYWYDDHSLTNPERIIDVGDVDYKYTAVFELPLITISGTVNSAKAGSVIVNDAGNSATVNYGTNVKLTAVPSSERYVFDKWSDGVATNPRNITALSDKTYEAIFKRRIIFTVHSDYPWSTVKAYAWRGTSEAITATWPGDSMLYFGDNIYGQAQYRIDLPLKAEQIIFNNGSGGNDNQSMDITIDDTAIGYYLTRDNNGMKLNTW